MSDDIEIKIGTEMAESLRAFAELNKSIAAVVAKVDAVGKESQKTDQIQKRLGDEAKRVWESTRTAAERASLEQARYNKLLKDGYIDQETFNRAMEKLAPAAKTGFGTLKEWAGSAAGQLIGITSIASGVAAAIALVNSQFDQMRKREQAAAKQSLGEGPLIRNMGFALGKSADMTQEQVLERVDAISRKTGANRSALLEGAASVLSARGNRSASTAMDFLDTAATLNPSATGKELNDVAGGGLDLSKSSGANPKQAFGMIFEGMTQARVTDPSAFATNGVKAVANAMNLGVSMKEALALYGTFTQQSPDKTGAASGTGMVTFIEQINEAAQRVTPEAKSMEFFEKLELLRTDPKGMRERDEMVPITTPNISDRKKSRKGPKRPLTGEVVERPVMTALLTPGSDAVANLLSAGSSIPDLDRAGENYDRILSDQAENKALAPTRANEGFDAFDQSIVNLPDAARKEVIRSRLGDSLGKLPRNPLDFTNLINMAAFRSRTAAAGADETARIAIEYAERAKTGPNRVDLEAQSRSGFFGNLKPEREVREQVERRYQEAQSSLPAAIREQNQKLDELIQFLKAQAGGSVRSSANGAVPALRSGEKVP
jgi:hypothetical protein